MPFTCTGGECDNFLLKVRKKEFHEFTKTAYLKKVKILKK